MFPESREIFYGQTLGLLFTLQTALYAHLQTLDTIYIQAVANCDICLYYM